MQQLFDLLATAGSPLLLIGGHALAAYGLFRQTVDVDCLVAVDDVTAVLDTLEKSGYRESARTDTAIRCAAPQASLPDVDLLLVDRPTFDKLMATSQPMRRGRHEFNVPALPHLIALKLHAIRNQPQREARDFGDIAELLRLNPGIVTRDELLALARQFAPPDYESKLIALL